MLPTNCPKSVASLNKERFDLVPDLLGDSQLLVVIIVEISEIFDSVNVLLLKFDDDGSEFFLRGFRHTSEELFGTVADKPIFSLGLLGLWNIFE